MKWEAISLFNKVNIVYFYKCHCHKDLPILNQNRALVDYLRIIIIISFLCVLVLYFFPAILCLLPVLCRRLFYRLQWVAPLNYIVCPKLLCHLFHVTKEIYVIITAALYYCRGISFEPIFQIRRSLRLSILFGMDALGQS